MKIIKNKDRDKIVTLPRAQSKIYHFMCCNSKIFNYFANITTKITKNIVITNIIAFVKNKF